LFADQRLVVKRRADFVISLAVWVADNAEDLLRVFVDYAALQQFERLRAG